jgi:hypothetical protein
MDAYPEDYLVHNLPLILLSGLEVDENDATGEDQARTLLRDGGFRLRSELPPINTSTARGLLQAFLKHDASNAPWSAKYVARMEQYTACRIKSVGRVGQTPKPYPVHSFQT